MSTTAAETDDIVESLLSGLGPDGSGEAGDGPPALPDLNDHQIDCLTDDLAKKIYPYGTIARRYGMTLDQLLVFCQVPRISRMVKVKKSIWEADGSATDRTRQYWAIGMEHAAPGMINLMNDPSTSPATRVELTKIGAKLSGLDAGTGKGEGSNGAAAGAQFAVNITFSGNRVESISTTPSNPPPLTIEGETDPS